MIRHVLLDADGVLQRHPDGWVQAAEAYVGDRAPAFFAEVSGQERACLTGQVDFVPLLADALDRYEVTAPVQEVYAAVWLRIVTVPTTVDLVGDLRDHGVDVHLATNQQVDRAAYMRRELGYDDLFGESFYSCDVGAAKPEPAFFRAALDRIGAPAPEVLFVDDHSANVDGAREVGLAAEQWHLDEGPDVLRDRLAAYGLLL